MMLTFRKDVSDKNKVFGTLLTDLLKAFSCLTYGLDMSSLNLFQNYLSNRKQRTIVDPFFSSWKDISSGVPQGSILGRLLFNVFMREMFLILKTVYNTGYVDDNTPLKVGDNVKDVMPSLEEVSENLITWFSNNQMKLNTDK